MRKEGVLHRTFVQAVHNSIKLLLGNSPSSFDTIVFSKEVFFQAYHNVVPGYLSNRAEIGVNVVHLCLVKDMFDALEWLAAMCSHIPNKGGTDGPLLMFTRFWRRAPPIDVFPAYDEQPGPSADDSPSVWILRRDKLHY